MLKKILKKYLPKPVLHLYWLWSVSHIKYLKFKPSYSQDELVTSHKCDFMRDSRFIESYNIAVNMGLAVKTDIHWRAHTACWAAVHASKLDGDFIECGVNKGFLSRIIMEYTNFKASKRSFYLLDTYEGLAEKYITDIERSNGVTAGGYEPCYELVKKVFSEFENAKIIKGMIPETLNLVDSKKIAYLHIDMNCVIPEIEAAKFFWDRMVIGGIMLLDDYGHNGHEEQKKAFDIFANEIGTEVLSLPTGQGVIIKF